jgi:hypothetical protein
VPRYYEKISRLKKDVKVPSTCRRMLENAD